MEKYTEILKENIGEDRHTYTKTMFMIMGTIYRGVNNGRFTYEQGLSEIDKLGCVQNSNI